MIYLILSVLCVASFTLLFKLFERYHIHTFQAIVFNYWIAAACGLFFIPAYSFSEIITSRWLLFAVALGASFICVFTLVSQTVKNFSVSAATVSMKLGLVFPVIFAFLIYEEGYNNLKLIGIAIAFVAVILATYRKQGEHHHHTKLQYLLPFIVFVGSGLCDAGVQYANKELLSDIDLAPFVTANFFSAAIIGTFVLTYQFIRKKAVLEWKNVLGGVAVGVPNYFSFLFMLKALENMSWGSSVIFPVSNLSTIAISTVAAFILFKERVSTINLTGLAFAGASIILIIISNYY
ncbi:MAG: EamA family transporter [Bacteroidota bacterium]